MSSLRLNVQPCLNPAVSETSTNRENLTAWRQWSAIRQTDFILSAASRGLLNPLPPPGRRVEGIPEILCFVDDLGRCGTP